MSFKSNALMSTLESETRDAKERRRKKRKFDQNEKSTRLQMERETHREGLRIQKKGEIQAGLDKASRYYKEAARTNDAYAVDAGRMSPTLFATKHGQQPAQTKKTTAGIRKPTAGGAAGISRDPSVDKVFGLYSKLREQDPSGEMTPEWGALRDSILPEGQPTPQRDIDVANRDKFMDRLQTFRMPDGSRGYSDSPGSNPAMTQENIVGQGPSVFNREVKASRQEWAGRDVGPQQPAGTAAPTTAPQPVRSFIDEGLDYDQQTGVNNPLRKMAPQPDETPGDVAISGSAAAAGVMANAAQAAIADPRSPEARALEHKTRLDAERKEVEAEFEQRKAAGESLVSPVMKKLLLRLKRLTGPRAGRPSEDKKKTRQTMVAGLRG